MAHVVYVAGKSGGHIIPALTLASREHTAGNHVSFIALDRPLDRALCQRAPYLAATCFLFLRTVIPRHVWNYPWYMLDLVREFVRCMRFLRSCRATQLVSMGGYISVPAIIAARCLGIPVVMYELNAEPGVAVQWLSRAVQRVYYCFAAARAHLPTSVVCEQVQYPVRYTSNCRISRDMARAQCGIPESSVVFFVLGGSQGSQMLNRLVVECVRHVTPHERKKIYTIHQAGEEDICAAVQLSYEQLGVAAHVFGFCDDLAAYYCAADSIITRAGAGALHEILFFHRPALIIPLEVASTCHQVANAQALHDAFPARYNVIRQHEHTRVVEAFTQVLAKK